ncbi:MAG: cyclic nucleotide-binding domain-containing protein, partial [Chthoniobacterales bacterium]
PNRVKDALLRAAVSAEGVMAEPRPKVFVVAFAASAVSYEIKYWMGDHAAYNDVTDAIRTNIWYELKRQRITIPFPIRTLQLQRKSAADAGHQDHSEARSILQNEPLFQCLEESQLESVLKRAQLERFGRGERLIEEGAPGDSMFILLRGSAQVSVAKNGSNIRVGVLRSGDCFGEMSLLTGENRTATVRAENDCEVLEISKPVMGEIFRDSPECLNQLSELLAKRKLETEGVMKDAASPQEHATKERDYKASFLRRLRTVFEL